MNFDLVRKSTLTNILLFVSFFFLNFFLKILFLSSQPFTYDEIISVKDTLLDFGHIKHESEWDTNPPFYYYCLWIWCKFFGITEYSVRMMSVFFSSLSASSLFYYSKRFLQIPFAIGVVLMFTFHNMIIYYSHDARCYSLLLFIVIISSIVFYEFLKKPTYLGAIWLGTLNFLIIYTHYIAGLIVFFQFVVFLLFYRNSFKEFFLTFGFTFALVFLRFTKKQFELLLGFHAASKGKSWIKLAEFNDLISVLTNFFIHHSIYILVLLICVSSLFFYFTNLNKYDLVQKASFTFLFLAGFCSIIIFFFIGRISTVFVDRYVLFSIPFILIVFAYALGNFHNYTIILICLVVIFQVANLNLNAPKNMDYRTTAEAVKLFSKIKKPTVIIQTKDVTGLFAYYYDRKIFIDYKRMHGNLEKKHIFDINSYADLASVPIQDQSEIVLCQTFEKSDDSQKIFDFFRRSNYSIATSKAIRGVTISLIRKSNQTNK